mgnify:CR=1 FL=1
MIQQNLHIEEIGWSLRIFYCPKTSSQRSIVLQCLYNAGCTGRNFRRAMTLLGSGAVNTGLIFSNKSERKTIIVVGRSSDIAEFVNTLTHEINHFIEHVMEALHIESGTEDEAYFTGELFELLYRDAVSSVLPLL